MTSRMSDPHETPTDADLELVSIDERSWRLCDCRWEPNDAPHVVAYIERIDDIYDVVWMRGTRRRSRLASIQECLREAHCQLAEEVLPGTRPIRIAGFPPPRSA